ncbi:lipopolysaccharide biosynthesis protein [Williamsia sp. CHRR-6]|uniref:lipopolysaccharide biosynthesis protein n=1 Tax=Williamsia sp. CHRR-6 TaxID=2835871 RepID=UPI001BDAF027|nr:hypothetical protein [Williamsia sp. CHRR-6]MBT0565931.1 hypothetical protein [Williamsia sp. CHRR-6]
MRTAVASAWSYSGRVVGLGWTIALIHTLGFGDYGLYSIAVAAGSIINAGIDNAFFVRSLRLDEARYQRERAARVLFGSTVAIAGIITFTMSFVAGYALILAAGELLFNCYKSQQMRRSRPDLTMRYETLRQVTSIGLGIAYLYSVNSPSLQWAATLYLLPYLVIWARCLWFVPGHRPAFPGRAKEFGLLSTEAFAVALYSQGALLVIGAVADSTVAGYYSVAQVTAMAIAMIGQNFAATYIDSLRAGAGRVESGPSRAAVLRVASFTGATMAVIAVGILMFGGPTVGMIAIIMSGFVFLRTITFVYTMILSLQHRDALRVRTTVTISIVLMALLVPLVHACGGWGAAIAAVFCELALVSVYHRALYSHSARPAGATESAATAGSPPTARPDVNEEVVRG